VLHCIISVTVEFTLLKCVTAYESVLQHIALVGSFRQCIPLYNSI